MSQTKFSSVAWGTLDAQYSDNCHSSSHIFGSIGLRNKEYCVFNKQYTREEYEKLVPRIIEHMNAEPYTDKRGRVYKFGEFFPPEISPFAYNETVAQEYYPTTKERAEAQGYRWRDIESRKYSITKTTNDLPTHINKAGEDILKDTIACGHAGTCAHQCPGAFRLIPEELNLYRVFRISLPRLCPNCRHYERLAQRNPFELWHRKCMCDHKIYKNTAKHNHHPTGPCPQEFETSYAPERPEIVYCEACYNAEVA